MSNVPEGYGVAVDISYHQDKLPFKDMAKYVDAVIARATYGSWKDPKFRDHIKAALDAGMKVAAYTWYRPDQSVQSQIEATHENMIDLGVRHLYGDVEQHGHGVFNLPPFYTPDQISKGAHDFITGLGAMGLEMGCYTRATFVEARAWPITNWFYDVSTWLASWPIGGDRVVLDWQTLLNTRAPKVYWPYVVSKWPVKEPKLLSEIWQWTGDKYILPGILAPNGTPSPLDINYIKLSLLEQFTGDGVVAPPPPPVLEPEEYNFEVISYSLTIRSYPAIADNKVGMLARGDKIKMLDIRVVNQSSVWVKHSKGWSALVHGGIQYCRNI